MIATFDIVPVSGVIGAEIHGLDLAQPLDDATVREVRRAFNEHQVIFFRDQQLSPEQQIAFGRRFGELGTHPGDEDGDLGVDGGAGRLGHERAPSGAVAARVSDRRAVTASANPSQSLVWVASWARPAGVMP